MKSIRICDVRIDNLTLKEAVTFALQPRPLPCFTVTPNAVMLDACLKDPRYTALLNQSTLSLPDGVGVLRAAEHQGTPLRERIAGIAFGEAILQAASKQGLRVFLLGGKDGIALKAAQNLCDRYPDLRICGTYWGYFQKKGRENMQVIEKIRHAKADILFVCFGFPQQEIWIQKNLSRLKFLRLVAGLGGSLDVWAGKTKRAPDFFIQHGWEWAWRMMTEPKRLKNLPTLVHFGLNQCTKGF